MRKSLSNSLLAALLSLPALMPAHAQTAIPSSGSLLLPGGVLDLACTDLNVQGSTVLGAARIDQSGSVVIGASGTLNGGQGIITVGGNWNNSGSFIPGTSTVVFSDICGSGGGQITGPTTFANLTFSSTSGKPFILPAGHNITVTGNLVIQGSPGNPLQLLSSSGQTAYITLGPAARVTYTDSQVAPNVQIGAAVLGPTAIPTLSEYAMLLLASMLIATAALHKSLRRRKTVRSDSHIAH